MFTWNGVNYEIIAPYKFMNLEDEFGFEVVVLIPGIPVYDGYTADYVMQGDSLFLEKLRIPCNLIKELPEAINGVKPSTGSVDMEGIYQHIHWFAKYTGTLLIGSEWERIAYHRVIYHKKMELFFESGHLVKHRDISYMGEDEFRELCTAIDRNSMKVEGQC